MPPELIEVNLHLDFGTMIHPTRPTAFLMFFVSLWPLAAMRPALQAPYGR